MRNIVPFFLLLLFILLTACSCAPAGKEEPPLPSPQPVVLQAPSYMGSFSIPADNPLTDQGIELGRMLFYETKLSQDNSLSCASCHRQEIAFSDGAQFSRGVNNALGKRHSMTLNNLVWSKKFFWDGRAASLEEQALHPIQDPLEMAQSLEQTIDKLQHTPEYPARFKAVFGSEQITAENMAKALSQFIRTLISTNSRYDKYRRGEYTPTEQEKRGELLFYTHPVPEIGLRGGNCGDCHLGPSTAGDPSGLKGFHNNGLNSEFTSSSDKGLELITQNSADRGKFKAPSLRNIALTAPYMHDGRFQTLREVLEHYNHEELFRRPNVDILIKEGTNDMFGESLGLTEQEIEDIIAFLHMLSDEEFISNPAFGNPHKNK